MKKYVDCNVQHERYINEKRKSSITLACKYSVRKVKSHLRSIPKRNETCQSLGNRMKRIQHLMSTIVSF